VYVSGSVEFLSMIVGCARDAIVAETMHGTVAVWNAAAEELYGYPAAEMVGVDVSPRMSRRPADTLTVVGVELPASASSRIGSVAGSRPAVRRAQRDTPEPEQEVDGRQDGDGLRGFEDDICST
jgi:PAS domain-containing protein